jgi:hypothetical protein
MWVRSERASARWSTMDIPPLPGRPQLSVHTPNPDAQVAKASTVRAHMNAPITMLFACTFTNPTVEGRLRIEKRKDS